MSASADVPTRLADTFKPQNSVPPNVSKIFGHVLLTEHRSSMPAGARPRAESGQRTHHCGGSMPSSYTIEPPPGVAKRTFTVVCLLVSVGHAPSHTLRPCSSAVNPRWIRFLM